MALSAGPGLRGPRCGPEWARRTGRASGGDGSTPS